MRFVTNSVLSSFRHLTFKKKVKNLFLNHKSKTNQLKMFKNLFKILSFILFLLNQIDQIRSIRNQLINFEVYEEDNVFKSVLNVNSLIDLNSELILTNQTANEQLFDGFINIKLPVPLRIDAKLKKIQVLPFESNSADESTNFNNSDKTVYKLNLNIGDELYRLNLDLNHTSTGQNYENHEFTSSLDFKSINEISGQYLGTLMINKNKCPKLSLHHNFTTNIDNLIKFSSNLTEQCGRPNKSNEIEDKMRITIDFSTLINDLFDFKLDQVFIKQNRKGSELMTLLNKIYKIKVIGDYKYLDEKLDSNSNDGLENLKYQFYKRATFESSLPDRFPTFQIKYVHDDQDENKIKLSFKIKNVKKTKGKDEL